MPKPRPTPPPVVTNEADQYGDAVALLGISKTLPTAFPVTKAEPPPFPEREPVVRVTIVLPQSKHRRLRRALHAHETNFQKAGEAWVDQMIDSGEAIIREGREG